MIWKNESQQWNLHEQSHLSWIDILNDKRVIEAYNKIDIINPYPFNHGLRHVKNVCHNMGRLCDTLNIDWEEKEALLITCALHDVWQVDGVEEHGKKSKLFIINNFENELKNQKYYNYILSAIETHNTCDINDSLFSILIYFCDKMDFSKDRMEDNYREKYRYYCYEEINSIEFIFNDEYFGIDIISNNVPNFDDMFFKENHPKKVIKAINVLAKKLNRKPIMKNNGKVMLDADAFEKLTK